MGRAGRPAHKPTDDLRRQVRTAVGYGLTQYQVAAIIGIDRNTLRKHYRQELSVGKAFANMQVAASLFRMATDRTNPVPSAAIFWMKAQAGWRDNGPQPIDDADEGSADGFNAAEFFDTLFRKPNAPKR